MIFPNDKKNIRCINEINFFHDKAVTKAAFIRKRVDMKLLKMSDSKTRNRNEQ